MGIFIDKLSQTQRSYSCKNLARTASEIRLTHTQHNLTNGGQTDAVIMTVCEFMGLHHVSPAQRLDILEECFDVL